MGQDFLTDMLRPDGLIQEKFCHGIDVAVCGIEQKFSDRLAQDGSARLAGVQNAKPAGLEISDDAAGLGGLPAAFRTF